MIRLGHLLRPRRPKGNGRPFEQRQNEPPPLAAPEWELDSPLLYFSDHAEDSWRIRDACEGTQIFGATGSGKTSGSGRALARAFLQNDFGGLVLCAKTDEPELWFRYAEETGRQSDLIQLLREQFNFLHYEANRPGAGAGQTENLVTLFMQVAEIASQRHGYASADLYWERAVKQLLRNAVDLLSIACGEVTLPELFEVVRTAPQDAEEASYRGPLEIVRIPPPPKRARLPEETTLFETHWKDVLKPSDSQKI